MEVCLPVGLRVTSITTNANSEYSKSSTILLRCRFSCLAEFILCRTLRFSVQDVNRWMKQTQIAKTMEIIPFWKIPVNTARNFPSEFVIVFFISSPSRGFNSFSFVLCNIALQRRDGMNTAAQWKKLFCWKISVSCIRRGSSINKLCFGNRKRLDTGMKRTPQLEGGSRSSGRSFESQQRRTKSSWDYS